MKQAIVLILLVLLTFTAVGETIENTYISNDEITAYSVYPQNAKVFIHKTEPKGIHCVFAYEFELSDDFDGRIYVKFNAENGNEALRCLKIEGNKLINLNAVFEGNEATFSLDKSGVYALIDINNVADNGIKPRHVLCALPAIAAFVLCVITLIRRKHSCER